MPGKMIRLLLIEDDKVDQMAFERFVRTEGLPYQYDIAGSISEARRILRSSEFGIVISDYMLGDGLAFDVFSDIRDIPFIVVTGSGDEEVAVRAIKAGAYDYIVKDLTGNYLKTLPVTVDNALSHRAAQKELQRHQAHLEELVAERTADLNAANRELQREVTERKKTEELLLLAKNDWEDTFNSITDLITVHDADFNIVRANTAARNKLGLPEEGATVGTKCYTYYHGTNHPPEWCLSCFKTGVPAAFEVFEPHLDMFLEIRVIPRFDANNTQIGVIHVCRDITKRKQVEEERMRLATAIEQTAEAVFITGTDWTIQYVNPAFESLTGYGRDEILGKDTGIIESDRHDEAFYRQIRNTLSRGRVWSGRIVSKRKDGALYEADITGSPVRDKSGAIINYVVSHKDVTHELRLERQLRQAQKREAVGTLAAGIAHDFNNILAAIVGYAEMTQLRIPPESPERRNLDQLLTACDRAKNMVRQILTFCRQSEQEHKPMLIASVVREALMLIRATLPAAIEIRQEIGPRAEESIVLADPTQIHQIVMNLCTNAAHSMRPGGGVLGISLDTAEVHGNATPMHPDLKPGSYAHLTVSDTGHGMEASVIERIFDPYFTTKGIGEGTGLGLSVTQGIVKSSGGAITVSSEPGKGSVFEIFLPLIQEELAAAAEAETQVLSGAERVLFVDDEKFLSEIAKDLLGSIGYKVTATTSSFEALDLFRAEPDAFDLVITDLSMPGMGGLELARQLQSIRNDLPIILCSGGNDLPSNWQAAQVRFSWCVTKPYRSSEMAAAIRTVLGRNRLNENASVE